MAVTLFLWFVASGYLRFVIDEYDNLPDITAFVHASPAPHVLSFDQVALDLPQPAAACRSLSQPVAACRSLSQPAAVQRSLPQLAAARRSAGQLAAACRSLPQPAAACRSLPQPATARRSPLPQRSAAASAFVRSVVWWFGWFALAAPCRFACANSPLLSHH